MTNANFLPVEAALSGNHEAALTVIGRLNDGEPRASFALRMVAAAEANPNIKGAAWAAFNSAWGSRAAHYEIQRTYDPANIADIFATLAPQPTLNDGDTLVTLYRGLRVSADHPPFDPWWRGVSWTTDLKTAAFFATRYWMNAGSPAVVAITLLRSRIAWACEEKREFEVIPDSYIMELLDEPEAAAEEIGLRIEGRADLDLSAITDNDRSRWAGLAEART